MAEIAPKAALAAFTRREVENQGDDDWDGPHQLLTLHNVDGELRVGTCATILPDMPPDAYPSLILKTAAEAMRKADEDPEFPAPCAYLLQIEAFMARIGADASEHERKRFDRDGRDRKIRDRADAVEIVSVVTADVHGRLYQAMKRRDNGEITQSFHSPLDRQKNAVTGRFADALLAAAYATGMKCWGLPAPIPMSN